MSVFKNNFVTGITAAVAVSVLGPVLIPAVKKASRPLAKSLIKGGILLYEKGRESVAGAGEAMEDLIAEVKAEELEEQLAAVNERAEAATARAKTEETPVQPADMHTYTATSGSRLSSIHVGAPDAT